MESRISKRRGRKERRGEEGKERERQKEEQSRRNEELGRKRQKPSLGVGGTPEVPGTWR